MTFPASGKTLSGRSPPSPPRARWQQRRPVRCRRRRCRRPTPASGSVRPATSRSPPAPTQRALRADQRDHHHRQASVVTRRVDGVDSTVAGRDRARRQQRNRDRPRAVPGRCRRAPDRRQHRVLHLPGSGASALRPLHPVRRRAPQWTMTPAANTPVIELRNVVKTYGEGDTAVHAVAGVSTHRRARRLRRDHGRVRLRQVHADEHHRLSRRPDHRQLSARRRRRTPADRPAAVQDQEPQDRLHLPELQSHRAHQCAAQRRAAAGLRRRRAPANDAERAIAALELVGLGRSDRATPRPSCPAASSSASRSPGRSPPSRCCCSPTSPPAPWTATAPRTC